LIEYLETNEIKVRFCRICDLILPDHCNNEAHVIMKAHKKIREELQIKDHEDYSFSIISFHSLPSQIDRELLREKEKALKRNHKRLKQQIIQTSLSHESASVVPGKEINSANKKFL